VNADAPLIGRGFTSDVYAWGDSKVLKLFHGEAGRERAEREFRATSIVHAAGLPAPAAYEIIERDGRFGIVFERIGGPSLFESVQAKPWTLFDAIRTLAALHARIHGCTAPMDLPSQRDWIAGRIDRATGVSESERSEARCRLAKLPQGAALCHGDFHPGNVICSARGPVVIDWGRATRGHPLGDVAGTSRLMRHAALPSWSPRYMHLILRCLRPVMHRAYLRNYLRLQGGTRRAIEAWQLPLAAAAPPSSRTCASPPSA
jgi:uncharacterized protein (TIGR02172 family)